VFGAYGAEEWHISKSFYGRGESYVFYFDEDDIFVFNYTGANDTIQFSNETCIIIGGGSE
jgi:hypothetical protein